MNSVLTTCQASSSPSRGGLSPRTVNEIVVRIRSLLRFLYLRGYVGMPLAQAAPWLAGSREQSLPRVLDPAVGPKLIASCDASRRTGIRDRAILTLLVRLELRRAEITRLRLEDIDWRAGVITVRGKGAATDQLPLPADVGEALADYLEIEAPSVLRQVFLAVARPGPITPTAVSSVVQRVCAGDRGRPTPAPDRFRHSAGAELLRQGADLPEVGELLRHHHLQTTAAVRPRADARRSPRRRRALARRALVSALAVALDDYLARDVPSDSRSSTSLGNCPSSSPSARPKGRTPSRSTSRPALGRQTPGAPRRLGAVRVFARYLEALDPATDVPAPDL